MLFFQVLLLIVGDKKLAGMQIPALDDLLGGPTSQPHIQVVQPNLNLP